MYIDNCTPTDIKAPAGVYVRHKSNNTKRKVSIMGKDNKK